MTRSGISPNNNRNHRTRRLATASAFGLVAGASAWVALGSAPKPDAERGSARMSAVQKTTAAPVNILAEKIEFDRQASGPALDAATARPNVADLPVIALPTSGGHADVEEIAIDAVSVETQLLQEPPAMTAAIREMIERARMQPRPPVPAVPITGSPENAVPTNPPSEPSFETPGEGSVAAAPGDFRFFKNAPVTPSGQVTSSVGEPSVANNDRIVFQTGNWYAAISHDDGQTWSHVDPAASFSSVNGGFCCDQVVIYEPSRDILIWLLQYGRDANSGSQRLAIANGVGDLENLSWSVYTYNPQLLGFATGNWLDFPDMVVGTNFLYTTTNVFSTTCPGTPPKCPWTGTMVIRWPLDSLRDGVTANVGFFNQLGLAANERRFAFRGAHGSGSTYYFAAHNTTSSLRIYRWPEGGGVSWDDVGHNAFSWNLNNMTCPGPDGNDACGRADTRVLGAYRAGGELGFMWNSSAHGGFPFPYTRVAIFRESDRALLTNSAVWSTGGAFIYPSVGVNARGDLAGTIYFTGGSSHPRALAWINDDFDTGFAPLENHFIRQSTNGPNNGRWGDYLTARPHSRFGTTWIGSAITLQGGSGNANSEPRHVWFGRRRDTPPPRPSNDDCTNATVIPATVWAPAPMNTRGATKSGSDPLQGCSGQGPKRNSNTVWFRYAPPCDGTFDIDTQGSNYDTVLSVHRGNCGSLTEIACNDDSDATFQSRVSAVPVVGGTTYYIEVSDWKTPAGGDLSFFFRFTPTRPCNDDCANAESIRVPGGAVGTTVNATLDGAAACGSATAQTTPGVWYSVLGTGATMTASTCSEFVTFDTQISVFCGSCTQPFCADGNNNDRACTGFRSGLSSVSWCSELGRRYRILVHGAGTSVGGFTLSVSSDGVTCTSPPACTAPTGACCAPVSCLDGGTCNTGLSACGGTFGCICFRTAEGGSTCITPQGCFGLTPCPNGTNDCSAGEVCFVDSCCGGPVCAPPSCLGATAATAGFTPGDDTMTGTFVDGTIAGITGSCAVARRDDCEAMGGVYQGDNTSCTGITCPGPVGACCINGDCIGLTERGTCEADGGTWFADQRCTDVSCPRPPVACCLPDDRCVETSLTKCLAKGGRPQAVGATCANLTCTPDEACCGPQGRCISTSRAKCLETGGTPLGPNTVCEGDLNGNRVDDACEPNLPCDECGGLDHWVDQCKNGADTIPTAALIGLDMDLDCVADKSLVLSGPTTIHRFDPRDDSLQFPGLRNLDRHFDVLDTEIMSMVLGNAPSGVTLRAGAGIGLAPILPSFGAIAETTIDPLLADSFFDVFFEVEIGGMRLYNLEPLQVTARIDCLPPPTTYIHRIGCIKLFDSPIPGQGRHIANLVNANHGTFPQCGDEVAGDCFQPNGTPFCDDAACCDKVCSIEPACCGVEWSDLCANIALEACTPPDRTPPDCNQTGFDPPSALVITVQDAESGVCKVIVDAASNAVVNVPAFTPGTTTPITIVAKRVDNTLDALVALTVVDCAGNVTRCSHTWPQACCIRGGRCADLFPDECRAAGGAPGGPGTLCLGDLNRNGVDDACELNQPCDQCGTGPHWVDQCPGGIDNVPSGAVVGLDLDLDCTVDTNLVLAGPSRIRRSSPEDDSVNFPGISPSDGHLDVLDTEMVSMELTGGGVQLIAGAGRGQGGVLAASFGAIVEQPGDKSQADSFFDMFFEVDLGGGRFAYNHEPLRVKSNIDCVPPDRNYFHPTGCVDLFDSPFPRTGRVIARLVTADHSTFPACGDPGTGECTSKHDTPFCNDGACCDLVCTELPQCCTVAWDGLCTELALSACQPPEACCMPEGSCAELQPDVCLQQGGQPQGPASTCDAVVCRQPPVACCLSDGGCTMLTRDRCRSLDGSPGEFGSTCQGDADGNGRDDACEINEPCDECGPGPHWVDTCPGGVDRMPSRALAGLDLNGDCVAETNLILSGPVTVQRSAGVPHVIDTEIVAMTLGGGGVTMRAGAAGGAGGALQPSLGRIIERTGQTALADSFFDVFVEVELADGRRLYNHQPLRVASVIDCLAPQTTYIHVTDCIELFDSPVLGQGTVVARLVAPNHQTFPTEACCLLDGGCADLRPAQCRARDGAPGGAGSACAGDADGNGRDDVCETNEPCDECGPGAHWVDTCPGGVDRMPSRALAGLDRDGDCVADTNLILSGAVTVRRDEGGPHSIDTEIVAMTLTGNGVELRAGAGGGVGGVLRPSLGGIDEDPNNPALADSFFDIWVEVDIGDGVKLYNHEPLRVRSTIDCLPPDTTYIHFTDCVELFDSPVLGQGRVVARLVAPNHQTFPVEACCLPDGTCADIRPQRCRDADGSPGGPDSVCLGDANGNGRDEACEPDEPCDDCGPGPHWVDRCPAGTDTMPTRALAGLDRDGDCVADANFVLSGPVTVQRGQGSPHSLATEITAMTLTGGGLTMRAGGGGGLRPSLGGIIEQSGTPALADSFFDVFFEISGAGLPGPVYNHTPLRVQAKIDCLPPQTTYIHVVNCIDLYDSPVIGQGNIVARLVAPRHQTFPTEACCLPGGGCQDMTPVQCDQAGGTPGGPTSKCLGDASGNGVDDACEITEVCADCGPGPHWVDQCAAGMDSLPSGATVGLDLTGDCKPETSLRLTGPVSIERSDPRDDSLQFPGTSPPDGHLDVIDTQIVAMDLAKGPIVMTAGAGRGLGGSLRPSRGLIVEQPSDNALADSFFDVFFQITGAGAGPLYNHEPLRVVAKIDCVPPQTSYIHPVGCIPLFDSPIPGQGHRVANLVTADHTTHPICGDPAAGDCLEPNGTRFCDDAACCDSVCSLDPFCCEVAWNDNCAGLAFELCQPPQACCRREVTGAPICEDIPVDVCLVQAGIPLGPDSACQGDNNHNGIDDACEKPGDCDGNGQVDLVDWQNVVRCLNGPGAANTSIDCRCADLNNDGFVDMRDVAIFWMLFGL